MLGIGVGRDADVVEHKDVVAHGVSIEDDELALALIVREGNNEALWRRSREAAHLLYFGDLVERSDERRLAHTDLKEAGLEGSDIGSTRHHGGSNEIAIERYGQVGDRHTADSHFGQRRPSAGVGRAGHLEYKRVGGDTLWRIVPSVVGEIGGEIRDVGSG